MTKLGLLLTTGMNLSDAPTQRAYVERLAGHELAGLGLGTGFAHAEVPQPLREAAILPALDRWLARLFDHQHLDATCQTLAAAEPDTPQPPPRPRRRGAPSATATSDWPATAPPWTPAQTRRW